MPAPAATKRPRSKLRRLAVRALVFIALGLVTTIITASIFAALASHWNPERPATGTDVLDSEAINGAVFRTWSQTWRTTQIFSWRFSGKTIPHAPYAEYRPPESVTSKVVPEWSSLRNKDSRERSVTVAYSTALSPLTRTGKSSPKGINITLQADWVSGWPFPALQGRLTPDSLTDTQPIQFRPPWNSHEGMLRFRDSTPRISIGDGLWLTGHLFPLIPIWPGLLLDTIVYAAFWGATFFGLTYLRRAHRRRRNRCPHCAYDMSHSPAGSPCPECGRAS